MSKIYLETSVFNFCFADDAPDKKLDALKLFEEIKTGLYEPYASEIVTMTEVVNLREGYRRIGIFSPTEVIDNG